MGTKRELKGGVRPWRAVDAAAACLNVVLRTYVRTYVRACTHVYV